jgi:SAM-dependent MidA family methyltransferase
VPFSAFVDWALYDDDVGFYATGGGAGRRGADFVTSPEAGPLFGAVLARAVDSWWQAAGAPDPFVVVEAGAGPGTLARGVLAAGPSCAPALRWVLVERAAAQRERHGDHLPLVAPSMAFAPEDEDSPAVRATGRGPLVVSLSSMPRLAAPCVVLANELLDNLPFDLWERRRASWEEVRVALGDGGRLVEVVVPAEPPRFLVALDAEVGARVPDQSGARRWIHDALGVARVGHGGRCVVWDYCSTTAALARRPAHEWVRTYRRHERGGAPLERPGEQDVTVEVCLDQLSSVRVPDAVVSQAAWLRQHGIDGLVQEGRTAWDSPARDLAALRLRSRVSEAAQLLDPDGLGGFSVTTWTGGVPPTGRA